MGADLGPGREYKATEIAGEPAWEEWRHEAVEVCHRFHADDWLVGWGGDDDGLPCTTPEAVVAVAHLLVAAERIAGGAEVEPAHGIRAGTIGGRTPAQARGRALDLLRAVDEAEAHP